MMDTKNTKIKSMLMLKCQDKKTVDFHQILFVGYKHQLLETCVFLG